MQLFRDIIANKYQELYGISGMIGGGLFVIVLFVNAWDIATLLSTEYMLFFILVAGILLKTLSGIGIMLSYASFCTGVFKTFSGGMKGNPNRAKKVKIALLFPVFIIGGYGSYKILGGFLTITESPLDIVITIYGVFSLMMSVYIIPAIRGEYQPKYAESRTNRLMKRFGEVRFSLWKGYQTGIRKDYGKAYAKEFERYSERLDRTREQLSGVLLLPMGIALFAIPPIAFPLIVLWLRSFTLDRRPLTTFERAILVLSAAVVALFGAFVLLTLGVPSLRVLFDVVYGLGILASIGTLAYIVSSS